MIQNTFLAPGYDIGLIYKFSERFRYSLTYYSDVDLGGKDEVSVQGYTPFHHAQLPQRLYVGSAVNFTENWLGVLDVGLIFPNSGAAVPGTDLSSSDDPIPSGTSYYVQYHAGLEYYVVPKTFALRIGHYYQPSRSEDDPDRYHVTGGLEYVFWYIKASTAVDYAKNYFNFSLSLAPSAKFWAAGKKAMTGKETN